MNISFEGKAALVTGARHQVSALPRRRPFAESGASVALADWNGDAREGCDGTKLNPRRPTEPSRSAAMLLTMRKSKRWFAETAQGVRQARCRLQQCGRAECFSPETADTTREDYDRVMGINLRGRMEAA